MLQRETNGVREPADLHENAISKEIVDAAYKIHSSLGPGLLESVYEVILAHELKKRGLRVQRQVPIPIVWGMCDSRKATDST